MNTSLFVGLCEDAGLGVKFDCDEVLVDDLNGNNIAIIDEQVLALYSIDTYGASKEQAIKVSEIAIPYALTPIEERE